MTLQSLQIFFTDALTFIHLLLSYDSYIEKNSIFIYIYM